MNRVIVEHRVNAAGVLELSLPLGPAEAGRRVTVTVDPVTPQPALTPFDWHAAVLATAGVWRGAFERPDPGETEERTPLS